MKVILNQNVAKLGEAGDVRQVSDGYAINFLFPKKLAMPATALGLEQVEHKKEKTKAASANFLKGLKQMKNKLENKSLEIKAKVNNKGTLFAQVKATEIASKISQVYNVEVDPGMIVIADQIKQVGEYKIKIKMTGQDNISINLNVQSGE